MDKRKEIISKYGNAINKFCDEMAKIDIEYGTYAEIEIKNLDITEWGDSLKRYERNIIIRALDLV